MTDPQHTPSVLQRLEQAEQMKLEGKYRDALLILEQLLLEDPGNVTVLEEIADNELSLEEYVRAETAAQQAVTLDGKSYTGYYILGFIRSQENRWHEAVELLCTGNKLKANNAEILRCLGWALFNLGKRMEGIVTLERSLNLDSENTMTLCDLGVAYLELKSMAKAKTLFQRVLELEPDNQRAKECVAAVERFERAHLAREVA